MVKDQTQGDSADNLQDVEHLGELPRGTRKMVNSWGDRDREAISWVTGLTKDQRDTLETMMKNAVLWTALGKMAVKIGAVVAFVGVLATSVSAWLSLSNRGSH